MFSHQVSEKDDIQTFKMEIPQKYVFENFENL